MRRLCLIALVVLAAAGTGAAQKRDKEAIAKELQPFQGKWRQVSIESNGQKEGYAKGQTPRLTIRGDHYTVEVNGKLLEGGTLKLDPPAKPRAFAFHDTEGLTKGKTFPGIYEFTGDELRVCIARTSVARPTEFTAGAGSGRALLVFRRVKPPQ